MSNIETAMRGRVIRKIREGEYEVVGVIEEPGTVYLSERDLPREAEAGRIYAVLDEKRRAAIEEALAENPASVWERIAPPVVTDPQAVIAALADEDRFREDRIWRAGIEHLNYRFQALERMDAAVAEVVEKVLDDYESGVDWSGVAQAVRARLDSIGSTIS